MISLANNH